MDEWINGWMNGRYRAGEVSREQRLWPGNWESKGQVTALLLTNSRRECLWAPIKPRWHPWVLHHDKICIERSRGSVLYWLRKQPLG
jgi:hypothetical protein